MLSKLIVLKPIPYTFTSPTPFDFLPAGRQALRKDSGNTRTVSNSTPPNLESLVAFAANRGTNPLY